jgi:hypothetical protein
MHDLGEFTHVSGFTATQRDAERFASQRLAAGGYPPDLYKQIARVAYTDWRASTRAKQMTGQQDISKAYTRGRAGIQTIGVRVTLDLRYDGAIPPSAKSSASVLMNVLPGTTIDEIKQEAMSAWSNNAVQTRYGKQSGGRAVDARIVQLVAGGFPQAQI